MVQASSKLFSMARVGLAALLLAPILFGLGLGVDSWAPRGMDLRLGLMIWMVIGSVVLAGLGVVLLIIAAVRNARRDGGTN